MESLSSTTSIEATEDSHRACLTSFAKTHEALHSLRNALEVHESIRELAAQSVHPLQGTPRLFTVINFLLLPLDSHNAT
jgi:hypothetical protein